MFLKEHLLCIERVQVPLPPLWDLHLKAIWVAKREDEELLPSEWGAEITGLEPSQEDSRAVWF